MKKEIDIKNDDKEEFLISTKEKEENQEKNKNILNEKIENINEENNIKDSMIIDIHDSKNIDIDYYSSANCISSLFYYWAFKIIKLSHKVKITIQNLGTLKGKYSSLNFMKHFYYIYFDLDYKTKGLIKSIFRSNLCTIFIVLILPVGVVLITCIFNLSL